LDIWARPQVVAKWRYMFLSDIESRSRTLRRLKEKPLKTQQTVIHWP